MPTGGEINPIWTTITIPGDDPDTDLIATGGSDQVLRVWMPADGGRLAERHTYLTGATIRRLGHVMSPLELLGQSLAGLSGEMMYRAAGRHPQSRPAAGA